MNHRIKVFLPKELHRQVRMIARRLGIPTSSFISMIVNDTLISENIEVTKEKRPHYKNEVAVNVNFEDTYFQNVIIPLVTSEDLYTIKDLIIDCIEEQLQYFDYIAETKNKEHIRKSKIKNTKSSKYKEDTKKKYKKVNIPLDDYINWHSNEWGISQNAIRAYYLGKQINNLLKNHEKEQAIFSDSEIDV